MQATQRKTIAFTKTMLHRAHRRAQQMGVGFTDYIRFVVLTDLDKTNNNSIPTLSASTEKTLTEALEESQQGKTKVFKKASDLMEYIAEQE